MDDLEIIRYATKKFLGDPVFRNAIGTQYEDYYGIGWLAIEEAHKDFKPSRGKWIHHAYHKVRWAIIHEVYTYHHRQRAKHLREYATYLKSQPRHIPNTVENKELLDVLIRRAGLTSREIELLYSWEDHHKGQQAGRITDTKERQTHRRTKNRAIHKLRSVA